MKENENGLRTEDWGLRTLRTPSSEVHTINKDGITLRGAIFVSIGKQSPLNVKRSPLNVIRKLIKTKQSTFTAPAVVTKSATNSVDSICSICGLFILLYRKGSVNSVNSVWNIPVLTLIIFSHTESTEYTDFPFWRYISDVRKLHFESTEWHLFHCACLANRICSPKNLYIPLCTVLGGKSPYRQGSVLAWNRPWTWMSRRMTICQHRQDKTTAMMDVLNVLLLPPILIL